MTSTWQGCASGRTSDIWNSLEHIWARQCGTFCPTHIQAVVGCRLCSGNKQGDRVYTTVALPREVECHRLYRGSLYLLLEGTMSSGFQAFWNHMRVLKVCSMDWDKNFCAKWSFLFWGCLLCMGCHGISFLGSHDWVLECQCLCSRWFLYKPGRIVTEKNH